MRVKNSYLLFVLGTAMTMGIACQQGGEAVKLEAPLAEIREQVLTKHGHDRIDNYFWLNQREDPDVIAYLETENAYLEQEMAHTEKFQDKLYKELIGRIKQDDSSVPYLYHGYYYFSRYEKGKEYPVFSRKKGSETAEEEIMLNVPEMAERYDYYQVTGLSISPDNNILAFGVDTVSRRKYTIHFKDLKSGKLLADNIPNTTGDAEWAADGKTVFYEIKDETLRPYKIMRHVLGTDHSEDVEIYHEKDNTFDVGIMKSDSEKYLFIVSSSTLSTEYRYLEADDPYGEFKVFLPREEDHEYDIEHHDNRFLILTNYKAENFRLMETPLNRTGKRFWTTVIPHRQDVYLQGMDVFKDYLVLTERNNGLREIRIISHKDHDSHYIDFGEAAYLAYVSTNAEYDTQVLRYGYTSMTTPSSIYDYNMVTEEKTLKKEEEILGGFNRNDYQAERIFVEARDGTKIPVSLVYKKGFKKDGTQPLFLYGYGSYGASMEPTFSHSRLSLLDRGFAYAIAHIRGGGEMGRQWYDNGKLLNKKNTFTDFIDCAEFLIKDKVTSPDKLFAGGGSAGGLLIGAVINMRPDLFKGVIAAVPWVDVVTTMLDESIPLTTSEYDEWGNPNKKAYYDYMLSYSPYDNVTAQDYPAMLVTTGLHDSQVQYWEPAKWVAKLRTMKTDQNPLLLYTQMHTGHGGASGRFERYKRTALEYAFIFDVAGISR